jgi:hypothetical protein
MVFENIVIFIASKPDPPYMISSQWLYQWCDYANVPIEAFTKSAKSSHNRSQSVETMIFDDLDDIYQSSIKKELYSYEGDKMKVVEEDAIYDRPG